jgi:hypothetical protein
VTLADFKPGMAFYKPDFFTFNFWVLEHTSEGRVLGYYETCFTSGFDRLSLEELRRLERAPKSDMGEQVWQQLLARAKSPPKEWKPPEKLSFPAIPGGMPPITAADIVGVQPMSGPDVPNVALEFTYKKD